MDQQRFEVGKEARGRVLGDEYVTRALSTADSFNLEFQQLVTEYCWGEIWGPFCEFPDQWQLLRSDRSLVRNAFDESLRWDSPSRMAGRITTTEVDIGGITVPAGERCGLLFAAANRDPRKWDDPDRFDVQRDLTGQLGWGFGVHVCVGRQLALLEADALLSALADRVQRWEPAGEPSPWMTAIGHGPAALTVRLYAA